MVITLFLFQSKDHQLSQLEKDVKDHEEQKRSLKTQVIQEQQKLVDCEREWKDIVGKQEREIKDLKMEV